MKKHITKVMFIAIIIGISYFGGALVFREYRINPSNEYYGNFLPGAPQVVARTDEQIRKRREARTRKPTLLEKFFWPAETVLHRISW
jgi:hypothetical protein